MLRSIISVCNYNIRNRIVNNSLIVSVNSNELNYINPVLSVITRNSRYSVETKKRRKTYPFHWLPKSEKSENFKTYLTKENKQFIDDIVKEKFTLKPGESPLKIEQFERCQYEPGSMRSGVIAKKIGQQPLWTKSGKRILTTVLQVSDNHVISYIKNEDFAQTRRPFYNFHKYKHLDVLVVGAENADPRNYKSSYLGLFKNANIPPKKKLTRFFITPNAKLAPGTPISVNHFRVGDYVDIFGKTRDHGFQGVIKRWNFKGQLLHRGVTKAHRRIGSIARGRKLMGPLKGKKMPGHMGSERNVIKSLKIWRINTKYNLIWVQGPAVPGANNSWVYIYDTAVKEKKYLHDNPPPFPTYYNENGEEVKENIYDKELHAFDEPSLLFEETEEEKKAALAALRMSKKAKIAKIR